MPGKPESTALISGSAPPSGTGPAGARVQQFIYGGCLGLLMILISATLINLNKYLMSREIFPYAVVLILMQSLFCTLFAGLLRVACPALFPALTDPERRVEVDVDFILRRTAPVAVLFTMSLVLGNLAYKFASVPFLQMIKESNVAIVYILSVLVSLEVFKARNAMIIVAICAATAATVHGALHFSLVGLLLQAMCCFAESSKVVVQGILMSGGGRKLDGLSYVLVVMPQVFIAVGLLVLVDLTLIDLSFVAVPTWADMYEFRWILFANVVIAFALNLVAALFIKNSSPLAFLLCNIAKDALIVLGGAMIFNEPLSIEQAVAFPMQLALILFWSLLKTFPELFDQAGTASSSTPCGHHSQQKPQRRASASA